ncbi:unnamed protein product [Owenia fusiformis]|uniref:Uncharacterized protein n=1 Tax=Owenia fusiformis TaxID=6347 RepID=A0A8J1TKV5_OWEFU|nr:unnamed protein product [Owenia fusiformis]
MRVKCISCWIISIFIGFVSVCTVTSQVIIEEVPSDKAAIVGDSEAVLTCRVSAEVPHLISWTLDGIPISSNEKVAEELKSKYTIKNKYDLAVKNVQLEDAGPYACNQNLPDTKFIGIAELNVYGEIVCAEDTIIKMENDSISLECLVGFVGDDKYIPKFAWDLNGKLITSTFANKTFQGKTKFVESGISLVAIPEMDGGIISCHYKVPAESGGVMIADRCRRKVVVKYAARKPSILMDSDDVTDLERLYDKDKHVILTCTSMGNPVPRYTWSYKQLPTRKNIQITEPVEKDLKSNSGVLDLGFVNINHTGVYTCKAINIHNRATVESEVILKVIISGKSSTYTCIVAGITCTVFGGVIGFVVAIGIISALAYWVFKLHKKIYKMRKQESSQGNPSDTRSSRCPSNDEAVSFMASTPGEDVELQQNTYNLV